MSRPSFQFYPDDWLANAKLKACSHAEKGVWMELLCLFHQADEYGILRLNLERLAYMARCRTSVCRALFEKQVLKGSDDALSSPLIYVPYHARQEGAPVVLIPAQQGPIWFSSRMVRDEYKRQTAGKETRFGSPSRGQGETPNHRDGERRGELAGDGSPPPPPPPASSSSKTTPLASPTVAREPAGEVRVLGNSTKLRRNPNWQVPSLDDAPGLEQFARDHGIWPDAFDSHVDLQRALIELVRSENAERRAAGAPS